MDRSFAGQDDHSTRRFTGLTSPRGPASSISHRLSIRAKIAARAIAVVKLVDRLAPAEAHAALFRDLDLMAAPLQLVIERLIKSRLDCHLQSRCHLPPRRVQSCLRVLIEVEQ